MGNKRKDWEFRIQQEFKASDSGYFITLTYTEENVPYDPETGVPILQKSHLSTFLKDLRQSIHRMEVRYNKLEKVPQKWKKLRFFGTGEYGSESERPHYHLLLFNLPGWFDITRVHNLCMEIWKMGLVHVGNVTPASIAYCTKYMITMRDKEFPVKEFNLMSRNPGIGITYVDKASQYHAETQAFFVTKEGGIKQKIPRYYKNKIFSETDIEENNLKSVKVKDKLTYEQNGRFIDGREVYSKNIKKQITKNSKL